MIVDDLKFSILNDAFSGRLSKTVSSDMRINEMKKMIVQNHKNLIRKNVIKIDKKITYPNEKEFPYEIPPTWEWNKLYYVIDVRDGTHDSPKYHKQGIPLITSKNLNADGTLDTKNVKYISEEDANLINNRSRVDVGDILFAMIGSIGNPVIISDVSNFCIKNVALFKNPIKDILDNNYLYYYLYFSQVKMKKESSGGVQQFVSLNYLRNFYIPLPPVEEQQRIVDKIGELFAKLDEIKHIEEELNELKYRFPNDMKKSILKSAIEGNLTIQNKNESSIDLVNKALNQKNIAVQNKESRITYKKEKLIPLKFKIPNNWSKVCIGMISDISSGGTPARTNSSYWNGNIPWLKIGDLNKKYISECSEYITEDGLNNSSAKWFEPGTILYTIFATIGTVGILNIRATTNQAIAGIKLFGDINNEYFYYVCLALKDVLASEGRGCAQLNINQEILSNVEIPIPPLAEQQRIVDKLEQLLPLCDDIEKIVNQ